MKDFLLQFFCVIALLTFSCKSGDAPLSGPGVQWLIEGENLTDPEVLDSCVLVLTKRLMLLDIAESDFEVDTLNGRIIVQINKSAVEDEARITHILLEKGELIFRETYDVNAYISLIDTVNKLSRKFFADSLTRTNEMYASPFEQYCQFNEALTNTFYIDKKFLVLFFCFNKDTSAMGNILRHDSIRMLWPVDASFRWIADYSVGAPVDRSGLAVCKDDYISGSGVASAELRTGDNGYAGVDIQFDAFRTSRWTEYTREHAGEFVVAELDGSPFSSFTVKPNTAGTVTIGEIPYSDAQFVYCKVGSGPLPTALHVVEKTTF